MLDGFLPQLLIGCKMTLAISCCVLPVGLALGLVGASLELSHHKILQKITVGITSTIRGLPELLVIFAIYFGGTVMLTKIFNGYTEVNAFTAGVIALGLIFGAYASQIFRGAFLAVPKGQLEAAKALGYTNWQVFSHILLPQAWRHALPGLSNLWLTSLKDSSLIALIGLAELMNKTQIAANTTHKPFVFYATAALIYLVLTTVSQIIMQYFIKRANHYEVQGKTA